MSHALNVAHNSIETAITHLTALEERLSRIDPVIVNHRDLTGMTSRALRLIEDSARLLASIDSSVRFAEAGGDASVEAANRFARTSYEVTQPGPVEEECECGCDGNFTVIDEILAKLKAQHAQPVNINNVINTAPGAGKMMDEDLARASDAGAEALTSGDELEANDPDLPPEVAAVIGALKAQGIHVTHAVRLN